MPGTSRPISTAPTASLFVLLVLGIWAGLWSFGPASAFGKASDSAPIQDGKIKAAIAKGVKYLKSMQTREGAFLPGSGNRGRGKPVGNTALAVASLIEAGVPLDDNDLQRALNYLREQAPRCVQIYEIPLVMMALSRTGKKSDQKIIRELGKTLKRGQGPNGRWSYSCTRASDGDHSCTQFGALGCWFAFDAGENVTANLKAVAQHFRTNQNADGGWAYFPSAPNQPQRQSTPSNTCAGLIALATSRAVTGLARSSKPSAKANKGGAVDPVLRAKDQQVVADALDFLESYLSRTNPSKAEKIDPKPDDINNPRRRPRVRRMSSTPVRMSSILGFPFTSTMRSDLYSDLYFLWSLERMAVMYGLTKVGKVDWYQTGAKGLLFHQKENGCWYDWVGGDVVGTSFAILFLTKANFTPKVTALMRRDGLGASGISPQKPSREQLETIKQNPSDSSPPEDNTPAYLGWKLLRVSSASERDKLLEQLENGKGKAYSDALADVVENLEGPALEQGRVALTKRMLRMTSNTLKAKLTSSNKELVRATLIAIKEKKKTDLVPAVLELLKEPDANLNRLAYDTLVVLTNRQVAFLPSDNILNRVRQYNEWKNWHEKNKNN